MKTVEIIGKRQAVLAERPIPNAAEHFVVVKNLIVPMCTEYKYYLVGDYHRPFGHEICGEVVETAQPGQVQVGDIVVGLPRLSCGGCDPCLSGDYVFCARKKDLTSIAGSINGIDAYSQYSLIQDWIALKVPRGISLEHACMAVCGLGPTFAAVEAMNVTSFDTVLITGMGPVGLGGVLNAFTRGAKVIAVESNPFRAELALALGAESVINPVDPDAHQQIMSLTNGKGVEKAVECSGSPLGQRLLVDSLRCKGSLSFVGESGDFTIHVSKDMLRKGITLHGMWHYNLNLAPEMWKTIQENGSRLDTIITHSFPMTKISEAFEIQAAGFCGKVLLDPWS